MKTKGKRLAKTAQKAEETSSVTHCSDKVCSFWAEVPWNLEINIVDATIRSSWSVLKLFEWGHPFEELEAEHAESPKIDGLVVLLAIDHLGWKIVESSAKGLTTVAGCVNAPAKITDFEISFDAK